MSRRHQLTELRIGDDAAAWTAAGFTVEDDALVIDGVRLTLGGNADQRGILSMAVDGLAKPVDGLPVHQRPGAVAETLLPHPNGVVAIDHLVAMTPDCDRTTTAFEAAGLDVRRVRRFEMGGTTQRQTFFWLGSVILELVGPDTVVSQENDGPATLWGLALISDDLDATAAWLGPKSTPPKEAVQPGRRIATLKTRDLNISTAVALMSPH